MSVSANLKRIRDERGLSNQQIADMAGLPLDTIKNVLREGTDSRISTIVAISKALNLTYCELLEDELNEEQELLSLFRQDTQNGKNMLLMIANDHQARKYNENFHKNTITCAIPQSHTADGIINALCRNILIDVDVPNAYMGFEINTNNFAEMDIYQGDIVLIEYRNPMENEIGVFSNGTNSYFRRYSRKDGKIKLLTLNKQGTDIELDNFKGWNILGTFIGVKR